MKHRIFNRHVLLPFILGALIVSALFVFGAAGLLLPVILYLDHDVKFKSPSLAPPRSPS